MPKRYSEVFPTFFTCVWFFVFGKSIWRLFFLLSIFNCQFIFGKYLEKIFFKIKNCWCECINPVKHHMCERNYVWDLNKYMSLWDWEIFKKYYLWLNSYMWWNYRGDKNYSNKNCFSRNYFKKNYCNNFIKKKDNLWNRKFLYFTHLFINFHITNDNCKYLRLSHKTLIKIKTFTISQHQ